MNQKEYIDSQAQNIIMLHDKKGFDKFDKVKKEITEILQEVYEAGVEDAYDDIENDISANEAYNDRSIPWNDLD